MARKTRIELNDFDEIINDERYIIDKEAKKEKRREKREKRRLIAEYDKDDLIGKAERKHKATIISLIAAGSLVIIFFITTIIISATLNKGEVYAGVYFNNYSLYGMTKKEIEDYINKTYIDPFKNKKLIISYEDKEIVTTLYDVTKTPDPKKVADDAYKVARNGNIYSRLFKVMNLKSEPVKMKFTLSLDKEILEQLINNLKDELYEAKEDPSYKILPNSVVFRGGKNGSEMNQLKLENDINDAIYELLETKNGTSVEKVVVEISTIKFKPLNVDEIFNEVYVKPVDSTYDRISPKEILITDSTPGKKLDRDALNNIVSRINKGENVIFEELPILDVEPEITREFLESTLVNYTIATSSNKNNNNDDMTDPARMEDRATNIQKCVDALNRYILFPGEEFNFWEALGTFNESTGYVYAFDNSAAAEQKVLGGGISQVASALYLAAFTSELEIVEHHNYPYTVNYGPLGFDAHVVKGSKNLIFKNTLEFPIRIVCSYEDETIKVEILGTDTNSNVRIRTSSTTKAISYDTEYIDDPSLPEGTEFITKGGIMGYEVQLFKRIIMNGVELLSEHIGTVVYQPRNQVITRGTGQIEDIEE